MAQQHFSLYDGTGVARFDDETGKIERYNDGEWLPAYGLAPEIVGGETGAEPIDESTANGMLDKLPKSGKGTTDCW